MLNIYIFSPGQHSKYPPCSQHFLEECHKMSHPTLDFFLKALVRRGKLMHQPGSQSYGLYEKCKAKHLSSRLRGPRSTITILFNKEICERAQIVLGLIQTLSLLTSLIGQIVVFHLNT